MAVDIDDFTTAIVIATAGTSFFSLWHFSLKGMKAQAMLARS
jgi:hypothetical protein